MVKIADASSNNFHLVKKKKETNSKHVHMEQCLTQLREDFYQMGRHMFGVKCLF